MKGLFRVILLIINLLFAGALIVSTLAGVIEPSRMVIVSILSYGYVVFLLANKRMVKKFRLQKDAAAPAASPRLVTSMVRLCSS